MSRYCDRKVCGTCRAHRTDDNGDWICLNYDSIHYTDYTEYEDCENFPDWEGRN